MSTQRSDLEATGPVPANDRRTRTVGRALAVAGVAVVLVAGCGRLHRDAASTNPVGDVTSTSTPAAGSSQSTTVSTAPASGAAVDPAQLDQISSELGTVDSQLAGAGSDVDAATAALNSQEGDPSK